VLLQSPAFVPENWLESKHELLPLSTFAPGIPIGACASTLTDNMLRRSYALLLLVRIYFALSPSYLHPDENFQGPEVIAGAIP
jgi:hypothetical protein